jgi:hypothetical protein
MSVQYQKIGTPGTTNAFCYYSKPDKYHQCHITSHHCTNTTAHLKWRPVDFFALFLGFVFRFNDAAPTRRRTRTRWAGYATPLADLIDNQSISSLVGMMTTTHGAINNIHQTHFAR